MNSHYVNDILLHYTIVALCDRMLVCTREGKNGTRVGKWHPSICPRGSTKPMDPRHSVQQFFIQSAGNAPTMGMIKVMYTGKQNSCYPLRCTAAQRKA